jgi:lipid-binding SYLF domain-containing protein
MKHTILIFVLLLIAGCIPSSVPESTERAKAQAAVDEFRSEPQLKSYFDDAIAYAVFPSAIRAASGFGGAYGAGWLYRQDDLLGRALMFQISAGPQLGVSWYRQILFFKSEDALRRFENSTFEFAGEAEVAVGPLGGAASPSYSPEVALFTQLRSGLIVEASVGAHRYEYRPISFPSDP